MKPTFVADNHSAKTNVRTFSIDVLQELGRRIEVAQDEAARQKVIKEARFYEGKAASLRALRDWLRDLQIEVR